jgi:Transcriptional regulator, AbiEi antitoxin
MRRLFTTEEALARGLTMSALRWGQRTGAWRRVERGVYAEGPDDPTALDRARAALVKTGGVACRTLAGELHGLDSVTFDGSGISLLRHQNGRRPDVHRRNLPACRIVTVHGLRCTDGLQTVVDLAAVADDVIWEQMLESALRRRLTSSPRSSVPSPSSASSVLRAPSASAGCWPCGPRALRPPRACLRP